MSVEVFVCLFTYTGASGNKTLNTTSHGQDKEKFSSSPGTKDYTCACAHIQDCIIFNLPA